MYSTYIFNVYFFFINYRTSFYVKKEKTKNVLNKSKVKI